jgi:hypothetical protein
LPGTTHISRKIKGEKIMKRSITYMASAMIAFGSSLASAGTISGSSPSWTAETDTAPALANFNGSVYAAWRGHDSNSVWYAVGPDWVSQQSVAGAETTHQPALAAAGSALYLAWRGQSTNTTDEIYYSTNTGSGFTSPHPKVCDGFGNCAETTLAPALAANGSTVYVAWTTASDTIEIANYPGTGYWTLASTPVPGATTTKAPALAVSGDELYLAWVEEGTNNIMYATLPLSGGSWSAVNQVEGTDWVAQTSVAPAFGVSPVPEHTGLYIAWTAPTSTEGVFTINFSQLTGSGFNPPVPIPPGPLAIANTAPALIGYTGGSTECGFASTYSFDAAYRTTGNEISFPTLQSDTVLHKCVPPCKGTTCN